MKFYLENLKIKIEYDTNTESPREWDNDSKMILFHGRYNLGDNHNFSVESFNEWFEENKENLVYLPVYGYDHGGLTISTSPFSCSWDSGQLGYIYMTKEAAKNYENPILALESEVKIYDLWIRGECYYYVIFDEEEVLDSCGGYIGFEDCRESAIDSAKYFNRTLPKQYELELSERT